MRIAAKLAWTGAIVMACAGTAQAVNPCDGGIEAGMISSSGGCETSNPIRTDQGVPVYRCEDTDSWRGTCVGCGGLATGDDVQVTVTGYGEQRSTTRCLPSMGYDTFTFYQFGKHFPTGEYLAAGHWIGVYAKDRRVSAGACQDQTHATWDHWEHKSCQCFDCLPPPPGGGDEKCTNPIPCDPNSELPCDSGCDTPVVLDLGSVGFRFTSLAGGVEFDLDGDGALERVSWTDPSEGDGLLALDRNGNGLIDDGTELFGNHTAQPDGDDLNGYAALAVLDRPEAGGNADGVLSVGDEVWGSLLVWVDANLDGFSQADELTPVSDTSIAQLELEYRHSNRRDRYGNVMRYLSTYTRTDGPRRQTTDVFFMTASD